MQYNKISTIRRLAKELGVEFRCANLNTRKDGDIEFVYENGTTRYYKDAEIGFGREIERLENFLRAAETM